MANLIPTQTSNDKTWRTPDALIDRINAFAPIFLDPCASCNTSNHFASCNMTREHDGLAMKWIVDPRTTIFVNPPYGRGIQKWMDKCAMASEYHKLATDDSAHVIALVPARTDTLWFPWDTADAFCFIKGRIKFQGADNGAPFPSVLIYWGDEPDRFDEHFSAIGATVIQ